MKRWLVVSAAALLAGAAALLVHLRRRPAPSGPVAHVESSFAFTVDAPFRAVAPLFGGSSERTCSREERRMAASGTFASICRETSSAKAGVMNDCELSAAHSNRTTRLLPESPWSPANRATRSTSSPLSRMTGSTPSVIGKG